MRSPHVEIVGMTRRRKVGDRFHPHHGGGNMHQQCPFYRDCEEDEEDEQETKRAAEAAVRAHHAAAAAAAAAAGGGPISPNAQDPQASGYIDHDALHDHEQQKLYQTSAQNNLLEGDIDFWEKNGAYFRKHPDWRQPLRMPARGGVGRGGAGDGLTSFTKAKEVQLHSNKANFEPRFVSSYKEPWLGTRGDGVSLAAGLYAPHFRAADGSVRPGLPVGFKFANAGVPEPETEIRSGLPQCPGGNPLYATLRSGPRGGAMVGKTMAIPGLRGAGPEDGDRAVTLGEQHHLNMGIEDAELHHVRRRRVSPPKCMRATNDSGLWENEDESATHFGQPMRSRRPPTEVLQTVVMSPITKKASKQKFLPVHNQTPRGRGHWDPQKGTPTGNASSGSQSHSATYGNPDYTPNRRPWRKTAVARDMGAAMHRLKRKVVAKKEIVQQYCPMEALKNKMRACTQARVMKHEEHRWKNVLTKSGPSAEKWTPGGTHLGRVQQKHKLFAGLHNAVPKKQKARGGGKAKAKARPAAKVKPRKK